MQNLLCLLVNWLVIYVLRIVTLQKRALGPFLFDSVALFNAICILSVCSPLVFAILAIDHSFWVSLTTPLFLQYSYHIFRFIEKWLLSLLLFN